MHTPARRRRRLDMHVHADARRRRVDARHMLDMHVHACSIFKVFLCKLKIFFFRQPPSTRQRVNIFLLPYHNLL